MIATIQPCRSAGSPSALRDGTLALEDFDLEIPAGAFFGLLGPNGAGKTTLISAVCNLLRVTEGEISVFGEPHDSLQARSWIGLAEQDINLDRFLTVRETLTYHGGYFGMRRTAEERAEEMIEAFGLRPSATCAPRSCPAASAAACCWPAR